MSQEKKKARSRLKRAVAGAAPELARALGGPLAGAAVEAIAEALTGAKDASEARIEKALERASPEQHAALRRAELEFRAAVNAAAVEEARIAANDRADARAREKAVRDRAPAALGGLIIGGFFLVLAAMIAQRLPPGAETEFSIMLGALATMTAAVVNYYFGSSAGSKEKTRLLSRARAPDGAA